jgi:hypothetical protein
MSPPVIITGMHRSGTSLLASMLHLAGLHLGDRLLGPGPGNRQGYFEDLDFIEFQDGLLASLGTTIYLASPPRGAPSDRDRQRGADLLEARRARPAWGWKDPRTALFLEFWLELAPDALFVFVYRSPAEVADSLRRRRDAELYRQYPGAAELERIGVPRFRADRALQLWRSYNMPIVAFMRQHSERCTLVRAERLEALIVPLVERLCAAGIPLRADADFVSLVVPELRGTKVPPALERRCLRNEPAMALLSELDSLVLPCDP